VSSCYYKEKSVISFDGVKDFDFTQILQKAELEDKTILFYFSSLACNPCRQIEEEILSAPEISKLILEKNIFIPLFVDDPETAKKKYWIQSRFSDDTLKRIGTINSELQIALTQSGTQPKFAIVNNHKELISSIAYTNDKNDFLKFLGKQ